MKNNILSNFQQMSAFKDSPFGQFWEKRLPPWAIQTYGPGRVYHQSNFTIIDASNRFGAVADSYNKLVDESWKDIQFFVFAHPDGNQVLKDYADSNNSPKENEVYFFIETNDGKFDFGKIVRVKLGKKAIEKLRFQFPFLNQTDEKELANEFLKRAFEVRKDADYDFVKAGEEIKKNPEEFKNLLTKAIKYDYQQKKFDDMSWSLMFLQGSEYLGLSIPQKLMQFSGEMRTKKYTEEKFWNAELPKDFTPAFLPNAIVPEKRNSIKENILKNVKERINEITSYGKEAGLLEQVYKEILNNVLLYLFDKFSSVLEEGLKSLDDILPNGETLNDLYNLNAFLVGLWNGCIEFAAGIVDLVALIIVIERDGFGYAISDNLTEQLENFFSEAIFGFEDFILKIWKKFNLAIKDFELWYLKYGNNSYYGYKILGELTPDILTIIVPELAASKAAKVSKAGTVATEVSEEALQKSGKVLSEKLEQTTAKKEVKEAFEKAEKEIDEKVNKANSLLYKKLKLKPSWLPERVITTKPDETVTLLGNYMKDTKRALEELDYPKSTNFGAKNGEFNLLNVPKEIADESSDFFTEFNLPWLEFAAERGDDFIVLSDKFDQKLLIKSTGEITGFGREIQFMDDLVNKGIYTFVKKEGKYIRTKK
jgi:hypothetical protein